MALKVKIRYPRIDIKETTDKIHEVMVTAIFDAAQIWVLAATENVPVLTGASKASFLKLAHQAKVTLTIVPRKASRIPLGIATSGGDILISRGRSYSFVWQSALDYIQIVQRHNAFLEAGAAALRTKKLAQLPQPVIKRSRG